MNFDNINNSILASVEAVSFGPLPDDEPFPTTNENRNE